MGYIITYAIRDSVCSGMNWSEGLSFQTNREMWGLISPEFQRPFLVERRGTLDSEVERSMGPSLLMPSCFLLFPHLPWSERQASWEPSCSYNTTQHHNGARETESTHALKLASIGACSHSAYLHPYQLIRPQDNGPHKSGLHFPFDP